MPATNTDNNNKPYVGPRTFEADEEHKFYGRDREKRDLMALIISKRIVLFYAASGAGKSSLFNTKVLPGLADEGFEVLPVGSVSGHSGHETTADNIFVYNLISSLHQHESKPPDMAALSLPEFMDKLIHDDGEFYYDEQHVYAPDEELKSRVLLIDQFEEILTTNSAFWQQRDEFFRQLGEALAIDEQLWLVLAIREDFVAELDPYLHYLPGRLRNRYYMQRLNRQSALQAIKNPVSKIRPFEDDAAQLLVDNLLTLRDEEGEGGQQKSQFVEPVQLQAVCYQMWEKLRDHPGPVITVQDVQDFADVDTALIGFYEETIATTVSETSVSEVDLRNWFEDELITASGTRNMVFRDAELTGSLPTEIADFVLKRFILSEVVRQSGVFYELVHDRFVHPVQESNREWRLNQPLPRQAQAWDDSGRLDKDLLDGRQLDGIMETNWQALGPLVAEFVQASQDLRNQEIEVERNKELEQQQILAGEQRKRADEAEAAQKRQGRLTRIAFVTLAIAVVFALLALYNSFAALQAEDLAVEAANRAFQSEKEAQSDQGTAVAAESMALAEATRAFAAQSTALAEATRAIAAESTAEAERELAIESQELAEIYALEAKSNQLAFTSQSILERQGSGENSLALMLAREAVLLTLGSSPVEAEAALQQAISAAPPWITSLVGHEESVLSVAFSPDGDSIVTASGDNTAKVWDAQSGMELLTLSGHASWVKSASFNPDGAQIVTASDDSTAKVWDAQSGMELLTLSGHEAWVLSASFSPDGEKIVTASGDNTAKVWDADSGMELLTLSGHASWVKSASFNPDGAQIVTASDDSTAKVWDAQSGMELLTLSGHTDAITSVAWAADGSQLATGSVDQSIRIWDLENPASSPIMLRESNPVFSVAFSPDGAFLLSGTTNRATLWIKSSKEFMFYEIGRVYEGHTDVLNAVAFDPSGQLIATASSDGTRRVWGLSANDNTLILQGHEGPINDSQISPDGSRLVTASTDGTARVWDNNSGAELLRLEGHTASVLEASYSPDGRQILTSSADASARIWDAESGEELLVLGHEDRVPAASFSPDGEWVATASGFSEGVLRIWDARTGAEIVTQVDPSGFIDALSYSPDGQNIATGGDDGLVKIWSAGGEQLAELGGHVDSVTSVDFSPDGRFLISGSRDNTALVWNLEFPEEPAARLQGHTGAILSTSVSPDGETIATASSDSTVRLWDLYACIAEPDLPCTAKQILKGHTDAVLSVNFCPDPARECVVSTSSDQTARLWEIDIDTLLFQAESLIQRRPIEFTDAERAIYGID